MKKNILLILTGFIFVISCDISTPSESMNSIEKDTSLIEDLGPIFASVLLNNDQIQSQFIESALKRFDGDTDVLVSTAVNFRTNTDNAGRSISTTFLELLNEASTSRSTGSIQTIIENNPDLNLYYYYPEGMEGQPVELVVCNQYDCNDIEIELFQAIDADGMVSYIDAQVPPSVPVIVLGYNERMDIASELPSRAPLMNDPATYLYLDDYSHQADLESWATGYPEWMLLVLDGTTGSDIVSVAVKSIAEMNVEGTVYTTDIQLHKWIGYGDTLIYFWFEDDLTNMGIQTLSFGYTEGGVSYSASVKMSSANVGYDVGNWDNVAGYAIAYNGDERNSITYSNGNNSWKIK